MHVIYLLHKTPKSSQTHVVWCTLHLNPPCRICWEGCDYIKLYRHRYKTYLACCIARSGSNPWPQNEKWNV